MTADAAMAADPSYEDLLQFLYMMPVGVLQCDEAGQVELVNAAAARLLAPALVDNDLGWFFPLLTRLCPELLEELTAGGPTLGPIGDGSRRFLASTSREHDLYVELLAVRVEVGRIMVLVVDVSLERQLVEHERAQLMDLNDAVVQDLVVAETALGLGDVATARRHVNRSADAGRAWLARQLELLGGDGPPRPLDLRRAERDPHHSGRPE